MAARSASSILEYLTYENPEINYQDKKNATLSENPQWIKPLYVRPWEEFSFDTMEKVFGGKLMQECRRARTLEYPTPRFNPDIYGVETGEDTTRTILTLWTAQVVNLALKQVAEVFNPVFWVDNSRCNPRAAGATIDDPMLSTNTANPDKPSTRRSSRYLPRCPQSTKGKPRRRPTQPDGAGISLHRSPAGGTSARNKNQLPREIKPGIHWTSDRLTSGRLTTTGGRLRSSKAVGKEVWPIIQIYHYCVMAEARYGFIITSKEALVVRIQPMIKGVPEGKTASTTLQSELRFNGLMEYKVIPWAKHRPANSSLPHNASDYKDLTINLSLWILFLLAGNNCNLDWNYEPLGDEMLKQPKEANRGGEVKQHSAKDDDGTPTEPSHSAFSSFAFSNPSFSFQAPTASPKPHATTMPVSNQSHLRLVGEKKIFHTVSNSNLCYFANQPPSYVLQSGQPGGSPTSPTARSVGRFETGSVRENNPGKRTRQTCDGSDSDVDVDEEAARGRRMKRKVV